MVELLKTYERLRQVLSEEQARAIAEIFAEAFTESIQRTFAPVNNRLEHVDNTMAELQGLLVQITQTLAELATLLNTLVATTVELSIAQRRAEERLSRLEETQRRTERRLSALEKQLGGITHTIGYALEDPAYRALPRLLQQDYGIQVLEALRRETLQLPDETILEVNILGKIVHEGTVKTLVGESKSQLSRRHIRRFLRSLRRLRDRFGEVFPVMVAHAAAEPELKEHTRAHGVAVYFSYEFNEPVFL